MKTLKLLLLLLPLLGWTGPTPAQTGPVNPNFSGVWKLTAKQEKAEPRAFTRTIRQDAASLHALTTGRSDVELRCDLATGECTETTKAPRGERIEEIVRTGRAKLQDNSFNKSVLVANAFVVDERWTISPDGKTLTVTIKIESPAMKKPTSEITQVWVRQD